MSGKGSAKRPQPNHEMADAYAQELCIDAMHDGTLKGNLAAAYLALKQSIAEVAKMKEEMMRAQRERDRADDRAEHWHGQHEALKQVNLDLWTELEMARRIMRGSGATSRDNVCEEFGAWNLYANEIPEEVHWRAAAAMADEIVCLRHIIANMNHEGRTNEREG